MFKKLFSAAVLTLTMAVAPMGMAGASDVCPTGTGLSEQGNNCKVTLCHATSAVKNPYVDETVSFDAGDGSLGNDNGHGDHFSHTGDVFNSSMQQGDSWGDIIPPIGNVHDGLNWTAEGQAIYNNGCKPVTGGQGGGETTTTNTTTTLTPQVTKTPAGGVGAGNGGGAASAVAPLAALAASVATFGYGVIRFRKFSS